MTWENLKKKRCPICGRRLRRSNYYMSCKGRKGGVYKVKENSICKFTINKQRYIELGGIGAFNKR